MNQSVSDHQMNLSLTGSTAYELTTLQQSFALSPSVMICHWELMLASLTMPAWHASIGMWCNFVLYTVAWPDTWPALRAYNYNCGI
jgi:hypothetical protein